VLRPHKFQREVAAHNSELGQDLIGRSNAGMDITVGHRDDQDMLRRPRLARVVPAATPAEQGAVPAAAPTI
jgi:hypothetical protein